MKAGLLRCSLKARHLLQVIFLLGVTFPVGNCYAQERLHYLVIQDQAAPFQIVSEGNQHSGIVSDLVFKIFEDSPHDLVVRSFPFKRLIRGIEDGLFRYWITYGSPSWGTPQNLNLTQCSILTVKHVLLPPKGEIVKLKNGIEDLLGQQLILLFGFDYPNLDEYLVEEQIKALRVQSYPSAFRALAYKRGMGFVEMESRIKYNLKQYGEAYNQYHPVDMSKIIPQYDIHFALSPNMPERIKRFIETGCRQLKQSGQYEKILNHYLN